MSIIGFAASWPLAPNNTAKTDEKAANTTQP
jgi:hypothetical protein